MLYIKNAANSEKKNIINKDYLLGSIRLTEFMVTPVPSRVNIFNRGTLKLTIPSSSTWV